uniref:DUF4279 domain-containing protein n=1 Tax=Cyanothece sp. (strain PCC 7425 / ATCC 29141) TaxID=395961 RepID=B8HTQ1_CYAP4
MKYIYFLQIACDEDQHESISAILNTQSTNSRLNSWELRLVEQETDPPIYFIDYFLNLLEGKYDELSRIGIERRYISVWMYYEYDNQCNIEFAPEDMKRLGEEGITLCISCWENPDWEPPDDEENSKTS